MTAVIKFRVVPLPSGSFTFLLESEGVALGLLAPLGDGADEVILALLFESGMLHDDDDDDASAVDEEIADAPSG